MRFVRGCSVSLVYESIGTWRKMSVNLFIFVFESDPKYDSLRAPIFEVMISRPCSYSAYSRSRGCPYSRQDHTSRRKGGCSLFTCVLQELTSSLVEKCDPSLKCQIVAHAAFYVRFHWRYWHNVCPAPYFIKLGLTAHRCMSQNNGRSCFGKLTEKISVPSCTQRIMGTASEDWVLLPNGMNLR